ncbi:aspartic peptidase domain-containing protein [Mycena belliarum]|uniref:Aspartic peptidase domain-containing protein n=1 Tax=Mycena belliarum TaxID=1033014 RepID=A0AAD6UBS0_9AGAR|nr:aspartic peptidase domain-containing protein [Mycena belliae]
MTMGVLAVLAALSLLGAVHAEYHIVRHASLAPRSRDAAVLPAAEFTVPFSGKAPRRKSKKSALAALRGKSRAHGASDTVVVDGSAFDEEYLTNATIGGQHFSLIVDTGSSDTWVAQKGFNCFDIEGNPVSQDTCAFGTTGFNTAASKTFQPFPNVSFNITYGDGEFLSGPVGLDTVTIGGMSVDRQEIGIPTLTAWEGDGINTGLIGFAFPDLTSVFNTTDPTKASASNQIPYSPLFNSAVKQKKVKNPFFSIALDRGSFDAQANAPFDPNLGFIAFGGIAPVPVVDKAVTVPVEGYSLTTGAPTGGPDSDFFFYTVAVEAYTFGNVSVRPVGSPILDTGTTLNFMSTDVTAAFSAQFNPPAVFDEDFGLFVVDCNAKVPQFGVKIGGKTFTIDARDQIIPAGTDDEGNIICITGTQDGGPDEADNIFILGDVFLHNVVATFNPIDAEVTLTQRAKY